MPEKKISDRDYLFLSSLVKARESAMLTRERLERMIAAGGFAEACKLLGEIGWPELSGLDAAGIDAALSDRRKEIFAEIVRFAPQKEVVDCFRLRYDYHNAKAIIKGEGAGVSAAHLLSGAGRVTALKLEEAFEQDDFRFIPGELGKAMAEAKSVLARTGNPQLADFVLDRAYFRELNAMAEAVGSAFLRGYVQVLTDSANVRCCVRCVRMGKDAEFLRAALLPGGTVSPERLAQSVTGDGVAAAFAATPFKEAALLGAEAMKGGSMTAFELECDNAVMRYLSGARMTGFGPELVIGYLAAEEGNITAVRMVLTGFLAGIAPERLKERLRDTYA